MEKDLIILILTKILRMFSYGAISVIFFNVLIDKGVEIKDVGILQSLISFGDIVISLYLTTRADKIGRRKTLIIGAMLKIFTGLCYAFSDNFTLLAISGVLGVISASGSEIGPFVPIEQAGIAQIVENRNLPSKSDIQAAISKIYGYYNMISYISQAFGAMFTGAYIQYGVRAGGTSETYTNHIILLYALFGLLKAIAYWFVTSDIQPPIDKCKVKKAVNCTNLTSESTMTIVILSSLFTLDSFGGGFITQTFLSFYFQKNYQMTEQSLGTILFGCNIIAGISGIVSSKLVGRIGALATMIFTHLPSNIFLVLIGISSNHGIAVFLLMLRFCLSQMDVPARQTYVSMVVSPDERSAANGITNIARSVGQLLAFPLASFFASATSGTLFFSLPFIIGGTLKIIYDVSLGFCFLWNQRKQEHQQKRKQILEMEQIEEMDQDQAKVTDSSLDKSEIQTG